MNRPNLNYMGADWSLLVAWLEDEQQTTYQRLANARATNDETQQLRGRAMLIAQLLGFKDQVAAEHRAAK
jgi:hypothetical protein